MGKTAIIYARVSSVRQADEGLPVESQIEQCHEKAKQIGAQVLKVFRDDGISGRTSKRAGLEAAFDFCEFNQVDCLITWSTSRFARNYLDAGMLKRDLERMDVKLVYVSNEFGADDDGWMAEAITSIIDERYSRQISKDTRRSMTKNATDGFFNGGRVPFGFRSIMVGKRHRLEPEPLEVPIVKMIFRWCMDGAGTKEIAVRLNESGIQKRGKRWDKNSVSSVLRNRAAIGQLVYRIRDREIVTQAYEPILSEEDFMRAQHSISTRTPSTAGGRAKSDTLFVGLLRCDACGEAITTETASGRSARYVYYNCRSFLKGLGCRSRRRSADKVDAALMDGILTTIFNPENLRGIATNIKASNNSWLRDHEAKLESLTAELKGVERRLGRLYESIEAGAGLILSDVATRIRELQTRQDGLKQEISSVANDVQPPVSVSDAELQESAEVFRGLVESCPDPRRVREFLSVFIRQIVLGEDSARIEYWPERIVNAPKGGSLYGVGWLLDLGSNQGPTD